MKCTRLQIHLKPLYFLEPGAFLIHLVIALPQNLLVPYSSAYDLMLNVLF